MAEQINILSSARYEMIGIGKIDRADRVFAIEWPDERWIGSLAESVKKLGLLDPLWVAEKGKGQYRLADGFRRLAAARKVHLAKVPVLVFAKSVDQLELFRARLARSGERLSAVEASRMIERLESEFDVRDQQLESDILPLLGLSSSKKILAEIRRLTRLEDSVARFCARNSVALREASLWADFPGEGQQAILALVSAVKPGRNLLRSYLRLLGEIALRDRLQVQEILTDRRIREVMFDPQMSKSGGRETVHRILRGMRNPVLRKIEQDFDSARKALRLSEDVSLKAPRFFEGDKVKVSFEIASRKDLEKKALDLLEASRRPEASRLFRVLGAPPQNKRKAK